MKKVLSLFVFFLLSTALSFNADAISRRGKSILRNVKGTIRISRLRVIPAYEKGPVNDAVISQYKNLKNNLHRAIRSYNRIPRRDFGDPEVQRVGKLLKSLNRHYNVLKKRVDAAAAEEAKYKKMYYDFAKKYGDEQHTKAMLFLFNLRDLARFRESFSYFLDDPPKQKKHTVVSSSWRKKEVKAPTKTGPSRYQKFIKNLEDVAKGCNGRFKGIRTISPFSYSNSYRGKFADWCKIIKNRKQIIDRAMETALKSLLKYTYSIMDSAVESVTKGEGYLGIKSYTLLFDTKYFRKKLNKRLAVWRKNTGLKLDLSKSFAEWEKNVKKARKIVLKNRKKWKFNRKDYRKHYRRAEKMAKSYVRSDYKGARIKKVAMHKKGWIIRKKYSIPVERYRWGLIMFKPRHKKYCLQYQFTYYEPYKGGGRYSKSGNIRFSESLQVTGCR